MIYNVCNFGAKGNGVDKDTEAFKKAIEVCEKTVVEQFMFPLVFII